VIDKYTLSFMMKSELRIAFPTKSTAPSAKGGTILPIMTSKVVGVRHLNFDPTLQER